MWHENYDDRLSDWHRLRQFCQSADLETALTSVNNWWQQTPWSPYSIHWEDINNWPDPWDLLEKNYYCSLARALGIVYTIHLMARPDISTIALADNSASGDNLVLINDGKYILNWAAGTILNITSPEVRITRLLESTVITKKIN